MTWALLAIYATLTAALALRASRGSADASTFAVGSGDMHPVVAGLTLGACLASSATFAILPGFVYADGLAALAGLTLPLIAGVATGLVVLAPRFQTVGAAVGALTVPHWIGARYRSPGLRRLFAGLQVLLLAYLVLIAVGCAYVTSAALGVPYPVAVVGIVVFVFGYTALGGATAHAWTNTAQGAVMLVVALLITGSGLQMWPEVAASLSQTAWTAPDSALFSTPLEVWGVPFAMGFALTTQPHLLSKALYVKGRRRLWQTLGLGVATYAVLSLVLLAGAYARVTLPAGVPQDQVMAQYLATAFPWPVVGSVVTVAILAASMSTMDGLLVALSASVGNDLLPGRGTTAARLALLGLAVATIAAALNPPALVLIAGQIGVYGLVVASAGPLLAGLYRRGELPAGPAAASALLGLAVHLGLSAVVANPGVAACAGLAVGLPIAFAPALRRAPATYPDGLALEAK